LAFVKYGLDIKLNVIRDFFLILFRFRIAILLQNCLEIKKP
jgi:hypothetical protein